MTSGFTLVGLRLILHSTELSPHPRTIWLITLSAATATILLGHMALAWREGRSTHSAIPRIHRSIGATTLVGLALATLAWLMSKQY